MFKIECPYCGSRSEDEFVWGGPAHIIRPDFDENVSDEEWAEYLHMRDNKKGKSLERWFHMHGCGEWFNMLRNSVTHEIGSIYLMGDPTPTGYFPAPAGYLNAEGSDE